MARPSLDMLGSIRSPRISSDALKKGGSYKTLTGIVQKVDDYTRTLTLEGGAKVEIQRIIDIDWSLPTGCPHDFDYHCCQAIGDR